MSTWNNLAPLSHSPSRALNVSLCRALCWSAERAELWLCWVKAQRHFLWSRRWKCVLILVWELSACSVLLWSPLEGAGTELWVLGRGNPWKLLALIHLAGGFQWLMWICQGPSGLSVTLLKFLFREWWIYQAAQGEKKKTLLVSSLPSPLYMVLFVLQWVKRRFKHPLLISHPSAVI